MGVLVEGMDAQDALKAISQVKFDEKIRLEKTELTEEEIKELAEEKKHLEEEMKKKRAEFEATAKAIMQQMSSVKDMKKIRTKLQEAGVPMPIINELAPLEEAKK